MNFRGKHFLFSCSEEVTNSDFREPRPGGAGCGGPKLNCTIETFPAKSRMQTNAQRVQYWNESHNRTRPKSLTNLIWPAARQLSLTTSHPYQEQITSDDATRTGLPPRVTDQRSNLTFCPLSYLLGRGGGGQTSSHIVYFPLWFLLNVRWCLVDPTHDSLDC